jgi:hypothetical protein
MYFGNYSISALKAKKTPRGVLPLCSHITFE